MIIMLTCIINNDWPTYFPISIIIDMTDYWTLFDNSGWKKKGTLCWHPCVMLILCGIEWTNSMCAIIEYWTIIVIMWCIYLFVCEIRWDWVKGVAQAQISHFQKLWVWRWMPNSLLVTTALPQGKVQCLAQSIDSHLHERDHSNSR